jgi:hypothetical protein
MGLNGVEPGVLPAYRARSPSKNLTPNGEANMKWKIRLARDMAQGALVVIEAPSSEEAEAILWHDMDPDVIRWSNDDVMGDREVIEICPAATKDKLTPLEVLPARQPKNLKTHRVRWIIEVEAGTPLSAARRARFCQMQPGTTAFEVCEVSVCAAQRYGLRSRSTSPPTATLSKANGLRPQACSAALTLTRPRGPDAPANRAVSGRPGKFDEVFSSPGVNWFTLPGSSANDSYRSQARPSKSALGCPVTKVAWAGPAKALAMGRLHR